MRSANGHERHSHLMNDPATQWSFADSASASSSRSFTSTSALVMLFFFDVVSLSIVEQSGGTNEQALSASVTRGGKHYRL